MPASIQEVLLRIVAEDDASDDLDELSRKLNLLDRQQADAEIQVDSAQARAEIASLNASLAALDAREINVDVDVDRAAVAGAITGLTAIGDAGGGASIGIGSLRIASAGAASALSGVFVVAVLAAVSALSALAASAAAALGALLAIATAFAATIVPAITLGIGAFQRFQKQADKAGTPAHTLKKAFEDLAGVFTRTLARAVDAVFKGLADALNSLKPLIRSLEPAFTAFGRVVGDVFRMLGREFARPAWQEFFDLLIRAAAKLAPILSRTFISFARILRDIATAAMPFLIQGLKAFARFIREIANSTSDTGSLRDTVGGLVKHLASWLELGAQIARVFLGFFKAAAPAGKQLVEFLSEGARKLADWLSSREGQERVRQFFEDVVPLVKELVTFFGTLTVLALQVFRELAAILTKVVQAVNWLLGGVTKLTERFGLLTPIGAVLVDVFEEVGKVFGKFADAVGAAWEAIKSGVEAVAGFVGDFVGTIAEGLKNGLKKVGEFVGNFFDAAKKLGGKIIDGLANGVKKLWETVRDAFVKVVETIVGFAEKVFNGALRIGGKIVGGLVDGVKTLWQGVRDAFAKVIETIGGFFENAFEKAKTFGVRIVNGIGEGVKGLVNGVGDLMRGVIGKIGEFFTEVFNKGKELGGEIVAGVVAGVKGLGKAIGDAIGAAAGFAADIGNAIIKLINDNTPFGDEIKLPGPLPDFTLPALPTFARGVLNFVGGLALVGEEGPELVALPGGSNVYPADVTRRLIANLDGAFSDLASPIPLDTRSLASVGSGSGGPQVTHEHYSFPPSQAGGPPDPRVAISQFALLKRQRRG